MFFDLRKDADQICGFFFSLNVFWDPTPTLFPKKMFFSLKKKKKKDYGTLRKIYFRQWMKCTVRSHFIL